MSALLQMTFLFFVVLYHVDCLTAIGRKTEYFNRIVELCVRKRQETSGQSNRFYQLNNLYIDDLDPMSFFLDGHYTGLNPKIVYGPFGPYRDYGAVRCNCTGAIDKTNKNGDTAGLSCY
ncbi:hypothetical protein HELRODRAFT_174643 [Helobdella robusta]|uniref:Uncharacterized protein n=1 Tax=Helobdella robusta TaxID=6412 RepID=T1F8C2_HELRO|nr:hypothetical protein HELRODRAFT_174643 [Helobdella robusta]ESO01680.1 hypothetical protein HELRODRAFT_174643 [Helobdella robusta]